MINEISSDLETEINLPQNDLHLYYQTFLQRHNNKVGEAWHSFPAVKLLEKRSRIPLPIKSVKPPGCWKDGNGKHKLMTGVLKTIGGCRKDLQRLRVRLDLWVLKQERGI